MPKATTKKIIKLALDEVSNVAEGSNGRPFLLLRAKNTADKPFDNKTQTGTVIPADDLSQQNLNRGTDMTPEEQKAKDAAEAAEKLAREKAPSAAAVVAPVAAATETVTVERATLDKQATEIADLRRALDETTTARAIEVQVVRAKEKMPLVGDALKVGTAIYEIERAVASKAISKDTADTIMEVMKRAQELAGKSVLFTETGYGVAPVGGAAEQLQLLAREHAAKHNMKYEQAFVAIARSHKDLYAQSIKGQ